MRLLNESHWVAKQYGLLNGDDSEMLADVEIVKNALVEAIASSHLANTGSVSDAKKAAAAKFFEPYWNIFTTNYDLLAYWVVMSSAGPPRYRDGFGDNPTEPEAPYVVFSFQLGDQQGIYYLHGGLHLYVESGLVAKHCWSRTNEALTTLIRAGMDDGRNPLFVAEGSSEKKLQQMYENAYLSYTLSKLGRIKGKLVVFGHSLSAQDAHLREAIAGNKDFTHLFIGVRDANNTLKADEAVAAIELARQQRNLPPLEIQYYLSATANVWGQ